MSKPCHDKGGKHHTSNSLYDISTCNIIKQNAANWIPPWSRDYRTGQPGDNDQLSQCVGTDEQQKKIQNTFLKTNTNSFHNLTKKQQYSRIAQGHGINGNKYKNFATQTSTLTNPNYMNLRKTGKTLHLCLTRS
uniref:Uncharacterized protein n=1 Tax=viral metagenome TaxID=1070528 RepID=A0A6C0AYK7_9ZZZZ|tara:strand:+ start:1033 stop:1434 length:402 start_codon:yes stop_codon:yes gene_type:complete